MATAAAVAAERQVSLSVLISRSHYS